MFKYLFAFFIVLSIYAANAQTLWEQSNMFEQKNFIENKGQYDNIKLPNKKTILYVAKIDGVQYYFSKSGYAISRRELVKKSNEELKSGEKGHSDYKEIEEEKRNSYKIREQFHELEFINSNPDVEIVTENKVNHYYSFPDLNSAGHKGTVIADAFCKLTYKNLYPNIDVTFEFPKDSTGIKYSIYLHPNADIENIRFHFPQNKDFKLNNGTLEVGSEFGTITDHQPISYLAADKSFVKSNFKVTKNQIGFEIEKKQLDKTVVIDPWTVTPVFGSSNSAYDVDYDNVGNTYVYGGPVNGPYTLLKYNPTGTLIWSYSPTTFSNYYGDFAVDRNSNNTYIVEGFNSGGAQIVKLNSSGNQIATFAGNADFAEMWRIAFSRCTNQAVIAGGGISIPTYQTCYLDSNLTNLSPVSFIPSANCCHDVGLLALDNYGNCYQETNLSAYFADGLYENQLVKLPLPALSPVTYNVNTNYSFVEIMSVMYYDPAGINLANGYNGLTTSNTLVYSYDGYVLKKWDGTNGNLLASKRINYPAGNDSSKIYWGGITADDCGNLFVADSNTVLQYDTTLTLTNSYVLPGIITDISWNNNNVTLYVSGLGFVSAVAATSTINCSSGNLALSTTATNAGCTTTGGATVSISGGTPPYTITWNTSPPQTGPSISNVPQGTYIVSVSESSCVHQTATDTVVVSASSDTFITTIENDSCANSITVVTQGGLAPYTYAWSNGLPNSATVSNLASGTYSVTITDAAGCFQTQTIPFSALSPPTATVTPYPSLVINQGESTPLSATGGIEYSWAPVDGLSCTDCPTPTASPLETTDYCVTVTNAAGCTDSTCVLISVVIEDTCGTVYVPNAFTPDENNLNEFFKPSILCVKEYRFLIFDRWGEKIFETTSVDEGWNGYYKGKRCKQDIYVYKLFFVDSIKNKAHQYIGKVTLLE